MHLKAFKLSNQESSSSDASLVVTESSGIESKNNSLENALSKSMNETQMKMQEVKVDMGKALDDGLVVTKSSGKESDKHDTNNRLGNGITYATDVDIRPVDSNTTLNLTNMCHRGGQINQNAKKVTPHYLPKVRESVLAKPHHVIARGSFRNSFKESHGSNDMAHNYYLEEANKKAKEKNRNLKPREMPSARTHHTPNTYTPKPRSNNQTFRNWPATKSVPVAAAPRVIDLADSPVSTSIDQDAPSTSIPLIQEQEHSSNISQGFEESPKTPTFRDDPLHESLHEDSTFQGSSSNMRQTHTPFESLEPKNLKQALTEPLWIDAVQEEIHEFKRLQD
nr:hypothetical protein [Tanacetum cinerariifolium]